MSSLPYNRRRARPRLLIRSHVQKREGAFGGASVTTDLRFLKSLSGRRPRPPPRFCRDCLGPKERQEKTSLGSAFQTSTRAWGKPCFGERLHGFANSTVEQHVAQHAFEEQLDRLSSIRAPATTSFTVGFGGPDVRAYGVV